MGTSTRRAIGIVRVSQVNGRAGPSFASPPEQRDRIRAECERKHLRLIEVCEEMDVSGGTPLCERAGLSAALEAIEAGRADDLAAAYFDRLFRDLDVQREVIRRVEAAGGRVLTVDVGQVTNGTAAQWLSGTMHGAMSEYFRRIAKERSADAQARAIARGVAPWPNVTPGYRRLGKGEPFVRDPKTAPTVAAAFQMRADGATVAEVRAFLAEHGIRLSYHGVGALLASRVVLGEIHFGNYEPNLAAHEPIVSRELWRAVQRVRVSRGRRAKSERLLARLDVLRCASCGGRMVVGMQRQNGRAYPFYRCGHVREDCPQRVTISADLVEEVVVDRVREVLADVEGRASVEDNARDAEVALERAESALASAIRTLDATGLADETAARERLDELRAVRDQAQERVDHLGSHRAVVSINAARDWDRLSLDARRALIRAVVARVLVAPGRGADRVTIELVSE